MSGKKEVPSLKGTFNAEVIYQMHSNPPIFGLYSDKLGYAEVHLADLKLTPAEIDALSQSDKVAGTYEALSKPEDLYHPIEGLKKTTWKVTSLKPLGSKPVR